MFYVGIDDTDTIDSPGTNQLARHIAVRLSERFATRLIVRHQLLEDPRVPCTSKNGCGSLLLAPRQSTTVDELAAQLTDLVVGWCPAGSDPGLCIVAASRVSHAVIEWGQRCQRELVHRSDACRVADEQGIFLRGLGGTEDGVIGALAGVGLLAARASGRVVYCDASAEDFYDIGGWQSVESLLGRGIDRVECDGLTVGAGTVDVGKRLRPNLADGRIVLFVIPAVEQPGRWQAVRKV